MQLAVVLADSARTLRGTMTLVEDTIVTPVHPPAPVDPPTPVPPIDAPAIIIPDPTPTLRYFGAKGDGIKDDSMAIETVNAAFNDTATYPTGLELRLGLGNFMTGTPLDVSKVVDGRGAVVRGSALGSRLFMTTDNTPIVKMPPAHSPILRDLWLGYLNPQPNSAINAMCIMCLDGSSGLYNAVIENVLVSRAAVALGSDQSTKAPVWGLRVRGLQASECSRNVILLNGRAGQPNKRFEGIYVNCPNMIGAIIDAGPGDNTVIENFEINRWSGTRILDCYCGGSMRIGEIRGEVGTCTRLGRAVLINAQNLTSLTMDRLAFYSVVFDVTGGDLYFFELMTVGRFALGTLEMDGFAHQGDVYLANNPDCQLASVALVDGVVGLKGLDPQGRMKSGLQR